MTSSASIQTWSKCSTASHRHSNSLDKKVADMLQCGLAGFSLGALTALDMLGGELNECAEK